MKKNIVIIAYSYPPLNDAGAQRPYALAKYLDKDKFNVTVLTCENPSSPVGMNRGFDPFLPNVNIIKVKSYVGQSINSFNTSKIKDEGVVAAVKKFIYKSGQNLVFPDKGAFWYPKVIAFLKQNNYFLKNIDIIFSTSPDVTSHRIAYYIKRRNIMIQWIADFRDFYYLQNWDNRSGIKAAMHKKLEASIMHDATYLTYVTKTMQVEYIRKYPQYRDKMHCVYNGFEKSDLFKISELTEKLSFFYAGSFYAGARSPLPLLQLIDRAIQEKVLNVSEVIIQIAGNIDETQKQAMENYISYQCIEFLGNIPRSEALLYMSKSSFLWLIVANIKSHYQTIPIKLFEYIAAKRPIINFAPIISESSQIIQQYGLGYNFNTLDFNLEDSYLEFRDLILKFKAGQFNSSISNETLDSFSWENQVSNIQNLI